MEENCGSPYAIRYAWPPMRRSFGVPGRSSTLALLAAFETCPIQATNEGQRRGDPLLQIGERLVTTLVGRNLRTRKPCRDAAGDHRR